MEFAFHGYMYQSVYTYLLACVCVSVCFWAVFQGLCLSEGGAAVLLY